MEDRRKQQRKDLIYQMKIFSLEDDSFFGYVKNITQDGLMIVSGTEKQVNRTHRIKMILPKTISGKDELSVTARSVWSRKDIDSDNYLTGFELIDVRHEDRDIITLLIEYFALK